MYTHFYKAYYGINYFETLLVLSYIEKGPFDCSTKRIRQEHHYGHTHRIWLQENVPANTTYYLIIYERVIEYCSLSNALRKIM